MKFFIYFLFLFKFISKLSQVFFIVFLCMFHFLQAFVSFLKHRPGRFGRTCRIRSTGPPAYAPPSVNESSVMFKMPTRDGPRCLACATMLLPSDSLEEQRYRAMAPGPTLLKTRSSAKTWLAQAFGAYSAASNSIGCCTRAFMPRCSAPR